MPVLLYGVGAIVALAGLVALGFGIPIELSFGNTLIETGTIAAVGGLILIGLGAAVSQLQKITEALAAQPPLKAGRTQDVFDVVSAARAATPVPTRAPFSPRPKAEPPAVEPHPFEPVSAELAAGDRDAQSFAPMLRNPDVPPVTVEDDVSLSPPAINPTPTADEPDAPAAEEEPAWREPPAPARESSYFNKMWPARNRPTRGPAAEPMVEAGPELPPEPAEPRFAEPAADEPRTVAVLKSGVVDGMAYTLYVDGSIEAELPQGTLHFASINELRSHLEKNAS